jgi:hypothetical protein
MQSLRKLSLALGTGGLVCSVAIAASTLLPAAPILPVWPVYLLVALAIIVHIRSAWISAHRRQGVADLLAGVPQWAVIAYYVWFVVAGVLGYASLRESRGQPTKIDHQYYLNNHGRYTLVTHAEYLHAQVVDQRTFSLLPSVFFLLAVLVNLRGAAPASGTGPLPQWRATLWWLAVSRLALAYGVAATLVWGWRAGLLWIVVGAGMMLAHRRTSDTP